MVSGQTRILSTYAVNKSEKQMTLFFFRIVLDYYYTNNQ